MKNKFSVNSKSQYAYITWTTAPHPDTASLSTAFISACEMVSNRSSGSWRITNPSRLVSIIADTGNEVTHFNLGFRQCIFLSTILKCIKMVCKIGDSVHKICDFTIKSGIHCTCTFLKTVSWATGTPSKIPLVFLCSEPNFKLAEH